MEKKKIFLTLLLTAMMCAPFSTSAQITIGSGEPPSPWSLLDLQTTEGYRKALHLPRMSTGARDSLEVGSNASLAVGLMIFNTSNNCLEFWNGMQWVSLCFGRSVSPFTQGNPESTAFCPNTAFTVTLLEATGPPANEITYQWQSSPDNSTWTNIGGNSANLDIPANTFNSNFYVRRLAIHNGITITSASALISLPVRADFPDLYIEIDGIKWATRNVGEPGTFVEHPADPGMIFQWRQNVGWHPTDPALLAWNPTTRQWETRTWNRNIPDGAWEPAADPCPAGWRVPTTAEFESLLNHSIGSGNNRGQWLTQDEAAAAGYGCQAGRLFGTGVNQVFFPAVGFRDRDGVLRGVGTSGLYWSHSATGAAGLAFTNILTEVDGNTTTTQGFFIRCVRDNPSIPTAFNQVTTFVNVMYDFQQQTLQPLVADGGTAVAWQWQVSTSRTGTYVNIPGAVSAFWMLPVDFIHNPAYNGIDELFFRVLITYSDGTQSITSDDDALGIRFIRTTVSGQGSGLLPGFGIDNGVRYAVINRARHLGNAANPNTIRVALLNLGAADTDGIGLGSLFQWGRIADGHQQIGWVKNPTTGVTEFGDGTSTAIVFVFNIFDFDWDTGQAAVETNIGRFIIDNSGWSTKFSVFHDFWGRNPVSRDNAPASLADWSSRGQGNNPCPADWYVPSRWDWSDMHSGTGTNNDTPNGVYGTFNHNNWEWRDAQANAAGGAILTNAHNNAAVFLPATGLRNLRSGLHDNVSSGIFWSSTHIGVPFHLTVNSSEVRIIQSSPAFGMSVRCVR